MASKDSDKRGQFVNKFYFKVFVLAAVLNLFIKENINDIDICHQENW